MRRKLTLPVWPPVAMTMPFLASIAMSLPSAFTTTPRTLPSRTFGKPPHQPRAVAVAPWRDHFAWNVPFVGDEHPRRRRSVRRDDRLVDEGHAIVEQELERRHAFVSEGAHQVAVVVAA